MEIGGGAGVCVWREGGAGVCVEGGRCCSVCGGWEVL